MNGLNLQRVDFVRDTAGRWLRALAVVILLATGVLTGMRQWELLDLQADVTELEEVLSQRRMQLEREQRRSQAQSPEERRVQTMLAAQRAEDRMRPALLRAIEQAWAPGLAVMSLKVEAVGKSVQMELMSSNLREVFAFADRLNQTKTGIRATVVRHGIKSGDPNLAILATLNVEQR